MTVEISWLVENRLLFVEIYGYLPPDRLALLDRQIAEYLDASTKIPVHLLIKDNDNFQLPRMRGFNQFTVFDHPRLGWTVMYGIHNALTRFITIAVSSQMGLRLRIVDTREQALHILHELDPAIPESAFAQVAG